MLERKKPSNSVIRSMGRDTQHLHQIWDQLVVQDDKLYRLFQPPGDDSATPTLQLVVPECNREEVMREMHSAALGGHLGEEKTLARVRERFYWPGYHSDVCEWCKLCQDCASVKTPPTRNRAPLQSVKVGYPLQMVAVDIVGPFTESKTGNLYILVIGDYFTRLMEAYAIPKQEATTVARVLTNEFFFRYSPPEQLHSDQGKQFESQLVAEICKLLGTAKTRTTPYHPQSDGLIKRFNRTLISMLKTAATEHPFDWEDQLRPLCMAYNSSINPTTNYSPFYLMFGRRHACQLT